MLRFLPFLILIPAIAQAAPFVAPRDPQCVAWSPDGALVALGFSGQSNGEFPPRPHPDVRKCGCVQIHDAVSGKRLRRIETYGDLIDLQFSPDGKYLAMARLFATPDDLELNEVRIWSVADGKPARIFDRCHGFAFTPDSREIVVLGRKTCAQFNLATGDRQRSLESLKSAIKVVYLDADRLAGIIRSADPEPRYSLRAIDMKSGEQTRESVQLDQPFYGLTASPGGELLATGHAEGLVLLWNAEDLKPTAKLSAGTRGIAHPFFSPDGELLAAGDQTTGDVVIWKASSGQELYRYTFQKGGFRPHYVRPGAARERPESDPARFVFAPQGDAFLSGCYGGIVRLVNSGQDVLRFGE